MVLLTLLCFILLLLLVFLDSLSGVGTCTSTDSSIVVFRDRVSRRMKLQLLLVVQTIFSLLLKSSDGFTSSHLVRHGVLQRTTDLKAISSASTAAAAEAREPQKDTQRRMAVKTILGAVTTATASLVIFPTTSSADDGILTPKFVQEYGDFAMTSEGWSFRDVKVGQGESPNWGDRVVFDWSGYTIGYFGRPFEAKGGPQGGAFDKELDYSRTVLGSNQMVKGLECAMRDMKVGGVRQVLVPYGELGYPADDGTHEQVGPKPTTFSGMRALNFVLDNPRVDRTLLFNVKLIRVDKPNGKGGFARG